MAKFYVTYGYGTPLGRNYSVVEAENYEEARKHIFATIGPRFAFMYDEAEFGNDVEEYKLTQIPLTPHRSE